MGINIFITLYHYWSALLAFAVPSIQLIFISSTQDNIYNKKRYKYQYFHRILSKYCILVQIFLMKTFLPAWGGFRLSGVSLNQEKCVHINCPCLLFIKMWVVVVLLVLGTASPSAELDLDWNIIGYSAQKRCRYSFLLFSFTPALWVPNIHKYFQIKILVSIYSCPAGNGKKKQKTYRFRFHNIITYNEW